MRIGLFIDFDGVLTPKAVNMQFASMLGIDKSLVNLEVQYTNGVINNAGFNKIFIPLFRDAGFSRKFVEEKFSSIQLDTYTQDIVQEPDVQVHIVTSSPSFYLDQFARKFRIDRAKYICSEYSFDSSGLLESCVRPCGVSQKEEFVRKAVPDFDLTIGVGDSLEQDGPFLKHCNIKILMGAKRREYFTCNDLVSILELVRSLKARGLSYRDGLPPLDCRQGTEKLIRITPFERNVFIITPFRLDVRYKATIDVINEQLKSEGYYGYLASDMTLVTDLWANVRAFMHGCKFGIALMTAHEVEEGNIVRIDQNVLNPKFVAEMGYMMGAGKEVLVLKDNRVQPPTDWIGRIYESINFKNPETPVRDAMTRWVAQLPRR